MLKTVIMGFGFAGLHLHYKCLKKILSLGWGNVLHPEIIAIDSSELAQSNAKSETVRLQPNLKSIHHSEAEHRILHICSPPGIHFENLKTALKCGYRQIIVEKPVVSNNEELRQIQSLQSYYGANIVVVANWVCSALLENITKKIAKNNWGEIIHLKVVQNKSRFNRSRCRSGEHVFDVEMPHQVSLALYLNGPAKPTKAIVTSMVMPDRIIPELGTGDIMLRHDNGAISELKSSLVHTTRERYLEIQTTSGYRLKGYFPTGGDDSYSRLFTFKPNGEQVSNELMYDDPLSLCFICAYRYFLKCRQLPNTPQPRGMDLKFNEMKVDLLEKSKILSRCQPINQVQTWKYIQYGGRSDASPILQ